MRFVSLFLLLAVLVSTPCLADVNSEATSLIGTMMETIGRDSELAAQLLDDQPKWTPEYIDSVIEGAQRTRVNLTTPLPVLLLYWTVYSIEAGTVNFRNDLYERDGRVLKELNGPLQGQARHER